MPQLGILPKAEFEATTELLSSHPEGSVGGWNPRLMRKTGSSLR
jgi:hypothetical protein